MEQLQTHGCHPQIADITSRRVCEMSTSLETHSMKTDNTRSAQNVRPREYSVFQSPSFPLGSTDN